MVKGEADKERKDEGQKMCEREKKAGEGGVTFPASRERKKGWGGEQRIV